MAEQYVRWFEAGGRRRRLSGAALCAPCVPSPLLMLALPHTAAAGAYCGGRTCKAAFSTPRRGGGAGLAARMRVSGWARMATPAVGVLRPSGCSQHRWPIRRVHAFGTQLAVSPQPLGQHLHSAALLQPLLLPPHTHSVPSLSPCTYVQAQADANLSKHPERGEANGALMRAAPLGVWGHRLPPAAVAAAARADAALSHPAQACRDASAVYSVALAHLVASPGDTQGALAAAEAWAGDAHAGGWGGWAAGRWARESATAGVWST